MFRIKSELVSFLNQAIQANIPGSTVSVLDIEKSLEIPKEEKFGDLSTNIFMKLAKEAKKAPRVVAQVVVDGMLANLSQSSLKGRIDKITIEGAGFVNFYYSPRQAAEVVLDIHTQGENFGKTKPEKAKKILLEFVSANPTGPLTVAHGRQAALGDCLTRILRFCGANVTKEYYNNDEGVQINTLGLSTHCRLTGKELPENAYRGDYLIQIAEDLKKKLAAENYPLGRDEARDIQVCGDFAKNSIMDSIVKDLADFDVTFDHYYSQCALGKSGKVEQTLVDLKAKGVVYENEGAVWLRSTDFGDDKDRVLVKSDKSYTYLTPDIAYHHEKFQRGFDTLVNILGPDHHGYIARLKASQSALGHNADNLHILIAQLVTLYEGDKQVRMSTRAGEFVTLRQILDEVGKDAGRFFFLMRRFDAHLDFDLDLAKSQTPDNPVFYIQYAHARAQSVKANFDQSGMKLDWSKAEVCVGSLSNPAELGLLKMLAQFEENILAAERLLEPSRLTSYLRDLAGAFHRFYAECRVVTEDVNLSQARMMLCVSAQQVIRTGLDLLGVSAPLKM